MIDWKILLLIFLIIVLLDKGLTYVNIKQVQTNFPEAVAGDHFKAEKNPVAKFLFEKFGLLGGTLIYIPLSVITLFIAYYLLRSFLHPSVALYIIIILYGFVIANNFYFLFKYSRLIP